jgi:hypothetical protein
MFVANLACLTTPTRHMVFNKNIELRAKLQKYIYIDGLVNGGVLVFTMLWTYTSSKSGLSARKSESNSGDATISLRMVNKDTSRTCITLLCTFTH